MVIHALNVILDIISIKQTNNALINAKVMMLLFALNVKQDII